SFGCLRSGLCLRSLFSLLGGSLLLRLGVAHRDDTQQRQLLAVAGLAAIVVPTALLEDDDLLALRLGDDLGRDGNFGRVLDLAAVTGQQNVTERDRIAGFTRQLFDRDLVS